MYYYVECLHANNYITSPVNQFRDTTATTHSHTKDTNKSHSVPWVTSIAICNGTSEQCTTTAIKYYLELPFHQSITPQSQSNPFTGISQASSTTTTLQYVITLINHCKSHTNTHAHTQCRINPTGIQTRRQQRLSSIQVSHLNQTERRYKIFIRGWTMRY